MQAIRWEFQVRTAPQRTGSPTSFRYRQIRPRPSSWLLTVQLRGRTEAPNARSGRTLSSSARGASPLTPHGPLQRLLDGGAECGAALPATMSLTIIRFQPRLDEANAVSGN